MNSNLELSAKRIDPEIQALRLRAAKGIFMPSLVGGYSWLSSERPKTVQENSSISAIFGGQNDPILREDTVRSQIGLTGRLPTGATFEALTGVDRLRNSYNRFNSEYISVSNFTVTQPLLRDFGFKATLAEIRIQKQATLAAQHELKAVALRIMRDVANAYYEMAFAQQNVEVKQEAVKVAANLVRENQRRLDEGRMAPLDVTQAQSRLSEAQEELVIARNFLAQRRNTLLELTRDSFDPHHGDELLVDRSFVRTHAPALDREDSLVTLFSHNPAYLSALELAKADDIRIAYTRNQRWPRVDLKVSYGYNGLGGSTTDAYKNYWQRTQPTWSGGLVINIPLYDITARSRVLEAKRRKAQTLLEIKRTEVTLLSAFDTAMRDIANSAERIGLVQDTVRLAQSALDAELRRLSSGMTTSYNVAQAQRDLSQARSRELATYVDLNKAVTQLYFVLGTLDEFLQVSITSE
jgi:outer membrane protein